MRSSGLHLALGRPRRAYRACQAVHFSPVAAGRDTIARQAATFLAGFPWRFACLLRPAAAPTLRILADTHQDDDLPSIFRQISAPRGPDEMNLPVGRSSLVIIFSRPLHITLARLC